MMAGADDEENRNDSCVLTAEVVRCLSHPQRESGTCMCSVVFVIVEMCYGAHPRYGLCTGAGVEAETCFKRVKEGWERPNSA